ncbi:MAG: metal ABC transporter substrate-binding protein [Candidatus Thorarchaeota archaeon]
MVKILIKKNKNVLIFITVFILFIRVLQVTQAANTDNLEASDLKVVVSLSMIGDWAQNVAGDLFTVTSIVSGLENPHTYDPSPSEVAAVASADLFIQFGLSGLEPWVDSVVQSSPPAKILTLINVSIEEYMEYDPVIGKKNPHVWMSPVNAKDMTLKIYQAFEQLLPESNNTLYSNYLLYQEELENLLNRIDLAKEALNGTKVVVNHPAFFYFFNLVGLERIGAIEEVEGAEPSAAHIADLTEKMLEEECKLIINQPQLDKEDVEALALDTDSEIAVLSPLLGVVVEESIKAEYGELIDEYIEMFDYNLYKIAHPYTPSAENTPGFTSVSFMAFLFIAIVSVNYRKRRKDS